MGCRSYLSRFFCCSYIERLYLPKNNAGWYDFYDHTYHLDGQTITADAPLEKIPHFVKAGAIIPMSAREAYVDPQKDTYRELMVFPFIKAGGSDKYYLR
ncbi:hypothetical protein ACQP4M_05275 [Actinobacillus pleuropneumoniae]|uniref:hypothetical protein n=1 Tax=Actinobacillus pleuropneumoniae TaxID=715 RepID=UPI003D007261